MPHIVQSSFKQLQRANRLSVGFHLLRDVPATRLRLTCLLVLSYLQNGNGNAKIYCVEELQLRDATVTKPALHAWYCTANGFVGSQ